MHSFDENAAHKRELAIDRLRSYIIDWRAGFRRQHGRGAEEKDIVGQPIDEVYQKYIELKRQRKSRPAHSSSNPTEEPDQSALTTKRSREKYVADSQEESAAQKKKSRKPEQVSEEQFEEQKRNLEKAYNLFRRRPTESPVEPGESNRSVKIPTRPKIKPAVSDGDLPQSVKDFIVMMLGPQDPCLVQHRSSEIKEKSPFFQDPVQRDRIIKELEDGTFGMPKQPLIPIVKEPEEIKEPVVEVVDERSSYKKKPIQKRQTKLHKMKAVEDTSIEPNAKKSKKQEKARQREEEERMVKGRLLKILSQAKVDVCTKESEYSIQPMLDHFMKKTLN
ncbi:hypothetical protein CLU79DRAFT_756470 [Phycomyces nitens]|nr:hypothetical protein CLU79DRAFT_756470 [Phycomyces nitens]